MVFQSPNLALFVSPFQHKMTGSTISMNSSHSTTLPSTSSHSNKPKPKPKHIPPCSILIPMLLLLTPIRTRTTAATTPTPPPLMMLPAPMSTHPIRTPIRHAAPMVLLLLILLMLLQCILTHAPSNRSSNGTQEPVTYLMAAEGAGSAASEGT
jgi:hypothetical protein